MSEQGSGSDHVKQGKALLSRVKQLRGHVGSDPSKADDLADTLNELTANRLLAHQFAEATGDAQEAVAAAARLLSEAGPVGAYTPPPLAARYYTAITHVAVAQVGLGLPDAAASTMATLDDFRAKLTHPLASALHPRTAVWALSAQARGCLAGGDVNGANAFADAAITRVERSGLRGSADDQPVVIDTEVLVSDTRWAAGQADESLQHLRTASDAHAAWAGDRLANAPRLSPALLRFYIDPIVGVQRSLADRLASLGRAEESAQVREALIERLTPVAGRLGPDGKALLAELESSRDDTAGAVPEPVAGWTPVAGEAALAPEIEAFGEPEEAPGPDLEELTAQRAAARAEADRLEAERQAASRAEEERREAERVAREREATEAAERERRERERLEQERLDQETVERQRVDQERMMAQEAERQRLEAERFAANEVEQEQVAYDRDESERLVAEQAEEERRGAESLVSGHEVAFEQTEREREEEQPPADEEEAERQRAEAERVRAGEAEREPALTESLAEEEDRRETESQRHAGEQERRRTESEQEVRPTEEPERAEHEQAQRELVEEEPEVAHAPDKPTEDPVLERYRAAQADYAQVRSQGGRRASRDAAAEVVDSLRPLLARDHDAWVQTMIASLNDLASARRAMADLWGARAASKEARDLERR